MQAVLLLADVGGTHTRLCLARETRLGEVRVFENAHHESLAALIGEFVRACGVAPRALHGRFAVACPVGEGELRLTNRDWGFSREGLCAALGLAGVDLVNDFHAIALSLPWLAGADLVPVGGGVAASGCARAVIGPGTGLGVSGLIPCGDGWAVVQGEGGHVTLAAADAAEARLLAHLRERLGHVSAERLLAGPGLALLYHTLGVLDGEPGAEVDAAEVARRAARREPLALAALERYFALLGTVAGNLALTLGARGGVYLAGGVLPRLRQALLESRFRAAFCDKGRFGPYLQAIPTWLVVHPQPALLGLLHL